MGEVSQDNFCNGSKKGLRIMNFMYLTTILLVGVFASGCKEKISQQRGKSAEPPNFVIEQSNDSTAIIEKKMNECQPRKQKFN